MRILTVHNKYLQPGGEDTSAQAEDDLLRSYGHEVDNYEVDNRDFAPEQHKLRIGIEAVWNERQRRKILERINTFRPDVVDVHNFFPIISPSVYYAAQDARVPVIQTLHNYRLTCANALLMRNGRVCEDCISATWPWRGALHACYKSSRAASLAVAAMVGIHRSLGTWQSKVATFIALTTFAKSVFVKAGLPESKIEVKPNFLRDPGFVQTLGGGAVFVGRLSQEKGIATLIEAWKGLPFELTIIGDGPLRESLQAQSVQSSNIKWLGHLNNDVMMRILGDARMLIFPSTWYEGLPRVLIEAFARGVPVVASSIGSMKELLEEDCNGMTNGILVPAGDPLALRNAVLDAWNDEVRLQRIRHSARAKYEATFTPEYNYSEMIRIYTSTISAWRSGA